jgi:2-oxoglutarate dehydrogenase E1 component
MNHGTIAAGPNREFIESLYRSWQEDPAAVDPSWRTFFEGFELGLARPVPVQPSGDQTAVVRLIDAYRDLGHFLAHLDPLSDALPRHPLLELDEFGLSDADIDRTFDTSYFVGLPRATLRELLKALRDTYCRTIGVEYMHIQDTHIRGWLQERMEPTRNRPHFDRAKKLRILTSLHYAELFERFLHTRYTGQKRFSLEGSETLIPLLEAIVEKAADMEVREIILGMAHRGRLNVLANILRKPYSEIFAQFEDRYLPDQLDGDGDVKYHIGFSGDRVNANGRLVHLSLSPNPSHLEAVDPVVEGRTRAKQTLFGDTERRRGIPLLIHGDAAFAGQGLIAETLNLSQLAGYTTGGTLHVIINNQIGFTTFPSDARSTTYCTDVAKMIQAPIFHVNCEDIEACVYVAELALDFRQTFHRDVVVDMFCFRRHGHNEGDDPSFTQPVMYEKIRSKPSLTSIYNEQLVVTGDLTVAETEALDSKFEAKLQHARDDVRAGPAQYPMMRGFSGQWKGLSSTFAHVSADTAVPEDQLQRIGAALTHLPDGFHPHPKLLPLFKGWQEDLVQKRTVPWPLSELLAFGSLLQEGTPVRLSGQDSRRGTFSQRHSVLHDYKTGEPYMPLNSVATGDATYQAYDSLLSEAAVLGFEFGYSLDAPQTLVLWEAQFGDFANGAQVIIDQFLAASESKWMRQCGLVLLLPHGYEGQGPEHSSARLERWLQLCAENNLQVCYPSTPAQYFHLLRRQMKRPFRKPLVVMTPKSLLRHKAAQSPLDEFVHGRFHEVLDDTSVDPARAKRVILCSGKIYYDLAEQRTREPAEEVALVRLEQFYPLHDERLARVLGRYPDSAEWVWVQEESQNMGAWTILDPRLRQLGYGFKYIGRDASASPATGSHEVHIREQKEVVEAAIHGRAPHIVRAGGAARVLSPAANGPAAVAEKRTQVARP